MRGQGTRVLCALAVVCTVATSCSAPVKPKPSSVTPQPSSTPVASSTKQPLDASTLASLPCGPLGKTPKNGEITFSAGHRLYGISAGGAHVRCLSDDVDQGAVSWSPPGDRFVIGESVISHPSGRAEIYVSDGRLWKIPTAGRRPVAISFLEEHEEIAYHPAGRHIAVVGKRDGDYGIWQATNLGKDPQLLADSETADHIFSLSYHSSDLIFVAKHEDVFDVHRLSAEGGLGTVYESDTPIADVAVSPFSGDIAIGVGDCATRSTVHVSRNGLESDIAFEDRSVEPVGWLPDGRLVALSRDGCDDDGDVFLWSPGRTPYLIKGVDAVAVRAKAPPPPLAPGSARDAEA